MFTRRSLHCYVLFALVGLFLIGFSVPALAQDTQVTYTVQPGENLFRIALKYGISTDALAQANGITDPSHIYSGQVLVIPGLSVPDSSPTVDNPLIASAPTTYVVQPGDTLAGIANKFGLTVDEVMKSNSIANANRIYRGQELKIWTVNNSADQAAIVPQEPSAAPPSAPQEAAPPASTTTYIVQPGEHLAEIGLRFGVNWTVIAQVNSISNPNLLFAGQQLIIPATNTAGGVVDLGILSLPQGPGAHVGVGKEIVIDLSASRAYAYQNGQLVYSALGSTGLPGTPTVQGDFAVYNKVVSQRMVGPGYDLPGVPWILYFYQGYSLHGTYWHHNFGQPMSHGCVNLTIDDAKWFYDWADIGTPVHVQA